MICARFQAWPTLVVFCCRAHHFPPFLAAVGHSTVSTPNTTGTLSVDPSVARNTLRSSTKHWAQLFSGRSGPGFSPSAIVPNITRRVSRSLCVRCTPPANRRRRLRMVVSTLSHLAFLRALAGGLCVVGAGSQ